MCQSWLSCYSLDSQSAAPAGFVGSLAVLLPHQQPEDHRRGTQASEAAEMHPRHLPKPGRYSLGHGGLMHLFGAAPRGWAEAAGTPEKLAFTDICIVVALLGSVPVKGSLFEIF